MPAKRAIVIGSGFAGLSAASFLAKSGFNVTILEKNNQAGGRARQLAEAGFKFDMGPSWYWMPDVFERYFASFGKSVSSYYTLTRLDPSYTVVFGNREEMDIPADYGMLRSMFESIEPGSGTQLDQFLSEAAYKYKVGINDLVYKPARSIWEFASIKLLANMARMDVFTSFESHIHKRFKHQKLRQLLEFPILFLGALAKNTPALYSLMNYADIKLGTWYPLGGMKSVVDGMLHLARELGVDIKTGHEVVSFRYSGNAIAKVVCKQGEFDADVVVGGADYHHIESKLLPQQFRSYSEKYWDTRLLAPSSLLFYLGFNKKLPKIGHHVLFFDEPFAPHASAIYETREWPDKPLFYVNVPSKTDDQVAPQGCENMVVLIPVAAGIEDKKSTREKYYEMIFDRLERHYGENLRPYVVYKKSYAHQEFINDYHSFKGNAYGLANTLMQTAILKPSIKSRKIRNLYYTGQLTVPGPGVPPSLISGQVVANEVVKDIST
ncbi:MAG: phytoene desaturase [Cyclobacteriaceae bacterium]|nr:phytoene desaturase [Cyclobacteriaceae bacterium]